MVGIAGALLETVALVVAGVGVAGAKGRGSTLRGRGSGGQQVTLAAASIAEHDVAATLPESSAETSGQDAAQDLRQHVKSLR